MPSVNLMDLLKKYQTSKDGDKMPSKEVALRRAAFAGNEDDVKSLVDDFRAAVNAQDDNPMLRNTALHWAAKNGHVMIFMLLLVREGDPLIQDARGKTAFDYNPEIRDIFGRLYQNQNKPFPANIVSAFLYRPQKDLASPRP